MAEAVATLSSVSCSNRPSLHRSALLLALALLGHLAVLVVLCAQLPAAAHAAHQERVALHTLAVGVDPVGSPDPFLDLTPPEVRSMGGPTLLEVLEGPVGATAPRGAQAEFELRPVVSVDAPSSGLVDVRFGRAPPVR